MDKAPTFTEQDRAVLESYRHMDADYAAALDAAMAHIAELEAVLAEERAVVAALELGLFTEMRGPEDDALSKIAAHIEQARAAHRNAAQQPSTTPEATNDDDQH